MEVSPENPVRLCCGKQHNGPICPDGKVMCCLCFERFEIKSLSIKNGKYVDVCADCARMELAAQMDGTTKHDGYRSTDE